MSVLVKGMEMPAEGGVIGVYKLDGEFYIYDYKQGKKFPIVELPPHGRLIDADALCIPPEEINAKMTIVYAPTIIEAEEGE